MQRLQIPFSGGEFEARAPNVNAARTVNLYPEVTQSGGKNKIVLYSTPGLKKFALAGVGPIRSNAVEFKDKLYWVSKDELISMDSGGNTSTVGTLNTENGRCTATAGRTHILVADGNSGYTWDGTTFLDLDTFARQGNDLVDDGGFDDPGQWTTGTGWSVTNSQAECDGSQSGTSDISQTVNPANDTKHVVKYVVSGVKAGSVTPRLGGTAGTSRNSDGTYVEVITTSSGSDLVFRADKDFEGNVDSVTVYEQGKFPDGATHVTYLDGFFVANEADSDKWFISVNEDPTVWPALDFNTASSRPDDVLAHDAFDGDLFLMGESTTEVYDNTGNEVFPFERYPNGILDYGIEAPYSIARSRNGLYYLGRTLEGGVQVLRCAGLEVQVVSDPTLDYQISQLRKTNDAIGWVYHQSGHTFYWLTFPLAGKSFVLDLGNGLWHERQYADGQRHRANGHGFLGQKHFVGDFETGDIYELRLDQYTDAGEWIHRIRRSPFTHKDQRRSFIHAIEVEFEEGVGRTTGQGSDPQALLSLSFDGGHTWTNDIWRPIGKKGEYMARAVWRKLGRGRDFLVEVKVTDPVPVTMIAAYAEVTVAPR